VKISKDRITPDDLENMTLSPGKIGELLVSGSHVCQSYFNNPDAVLDNKVFDHNQTCWHRMGDTGYFDESGRFFLTGRIHSTIIRNGEVLHAQLVEAEFAKQYPKAERIAAIELDGKLVVVIQHSGVQPETSAATSPPAVNADSIIFTHKKLPLDPRHNSKIDYNILREQLLKGKF
jgi:acyl-CoA synthetase (AMP-forming)/AMP-acid ligase II